MRLFIKRVLVFFGVSVTITVMIALIFLLAEWWVESSGLPPEALIAAVMVSSLSLLVSWLIVE